MFLENLLAFALFTFARAMTRTQIYDVFSKNRHAETCTAEMKTTHSKIACAMLCFGSDICCSASFYDGKCQLNTNCNGAKKPYNNAYAIQKPITNNDCKIGETGYNYNGTINKTVLGVTCQAWASQEPHEHSVEAEANYCRNPDLEYPGPWCYTTDPNRRWDFSPVFKCGTECGSGFFLCDCGLCIPYPWRCNEIPDCPNSEDEQGCDSVPECLEDEKGLLYVGKINVTKSGNQCKPWKSRSVAAHFYHYSPRNYCRNVYGFDYNEPRCFTGGDYRYGLEECDIPKCGSSTETDKQIEEGLIDIIYASPETLVGDPLWRESLQKLNVQTIVIDEFHTIATWGEDDEGTQKQAFRKWFGQIGELRSLFPNANILALSATCTKKISKRVKKQLNLKDNILEIIKSPNKENIKLVSSKISNNIEMSMSWLVDGFDEMKDNFPLVLIYCISINDASKLYLYLIQELPEFRSFIEMYHSETEICKKKEIVDKLKDPDSTLKIIISTSALGMGVDTKNFHNVILYGAQKNCVELVQEIGRAGRDDLPSVCLIL